MSYDFTGYHDDNNSSYQEKEKVFLKNIDEYLEKLIWEYKHWQEVKDSGKDFLLEVMGRANLAEYYVQMFCRDHKGNIRLLGDVLQDFLADNQQSFMTMLGDFGTGKSSFSMYYFIIQANKYLLDKSNRIPLFISLKDYQKKLDIQTFIQNEFAEKFNFTFSLAVFQNLMLQGRLLFFVDGFDEMASISSEKETIQNFKELNKLSFEYLQFMTLHEKTLKNKIFMTCRTHYFFTENQEKNILTKDYPVLYRSYVTKSRYQILRIYIQEFKEKQIRIYILQHTKNGISTQKILEIIKDTYNLKELANRPLLLAMIVKTLPSLKDKQQINVAALYQSYTNDWIERDDWRSQMTLQGKRHFMWELAFKMYKSGDSSLHYSQLDKPKSEFFKFQPIKNNDDAYYVYEITTCSFLNRALDGNYKFIHKSFMEYFLAEYYFYHIKNKKHRPINYSSTNDEIKYFLKMIVANNKTQLNGLNLSSLNLEKIYLKGANLGGANHGEVNFKGTYFEGINFEGAFLREANFEYLTIKDVIFIKANLEGANFYNTNIDKANFYNADLKTASFICSNLSDINFINANLENADFERANIYNSNFIALFNTDELRSIKFDKENMYCHKPQNYQSELNMRRANLKGANIERANFCGGDFESTNFEESNLPMANFRYANLEDANFQNANLEWANFEGANLKNTNFNGAKIKHAFFLGANIEGAKGLPKIYEI